MSRWPVKSAVLTLLGEALVNVVGTVDLYESTEEFLEAVKKAEDVVRVWCTDVELGRAGRLPAAAKKQIDKCGTERILAVLKPDPLARNNTTAEDWAEECLPFHRYPGIVQPVEALLVRSLNVVSQLVCCLVLNDKKYVYIYRNNNPVVHLNLFVV